MLSQEIVYKEYIVNKQSTSYIAKKYNTYANEVRRSIIKYGYKLRDRSSAQSLAIKSGRHPHPTKGKERSSATRIKISNTLANTWRNLSPVEYADKVKLGKKTWNSLTLIEQQRIRSLAAKANKDASINGSKLEKILLKTIKSLGYHVEFHKKDLLVNEKLHIDLFVPKLGLAIEVDGPAHFLPIWGEESLKRHIKADNEKNGLLLLKGFRILRLKCLKAKLSQKIQREASEAITNIIEKLSKQKMKPELIECEI